MKSKTLFPEIDIVVIGVNAARTLAGCLRSIKACRYPRNQLTITYVDGGSNDDSAQIAQSFEGVEVIELGHKHPTPGKGRNAGWRRGKAPLVLFLDADTRLHQDFLGRAVCALKAEVGAVQGDRKEAHADQSVFNWIGNLEWPRGKGFVQAFGGDVLIRREVLERTGGYDPKLIAGEDPELSRRLIRAGYQILHIPCPMTQHDLAMTPPKYWRRAFRSGYAFAEVRARLGRRDGFWKKEARRIVVRGIFGGLLICSGMLLLALHWLLALVVILAGLFLLMRPLLFRRAHLSRHLALENRQSWVYALHCSLVVVPQCLGFLRFHLGKWINWPLRNKSSRLATGS